MKISTKSMQGLALGLSLLLGGLLLTDPGASAGIVHASQGCDIDKPSEAERCNVPSIHQMSKQSEMVVVGRVEQSRSRWVGKKIITSHKINPLQIIKGKQMDSIEVSTYGGKVKNIAQDFSHAVTLEQGEVALMFLQRVPAAHKLMSNRLVPYPEHGKVTLLGPKARQSRLKNNKRLRRYLDEVTRQVKQGG